MRGEVSKCCECVFYAIEASTGNVVDGEYAATGQAVRRGGREGGAARVRPHDVEPRRNCTREISMRVAGSESSPSSSLLFPSSFLP